MITNLMKREEEKEKQKVEKKLAADHDGYAECYPGLAEMDDAVINSDDEADFSKMDMGNKKGPVGRWVCVIVMRRIVDFYSNTLLYYNNSIIFMLDGTLTPKRSMRTTWARRRRCPRRPSSMA